MKNEQIRARNPQLISKSSPFETLDDVVSHTIKISLKKLKESEVAVQTTCHPEAIHAMRVATRKLRAAIQAFKKVLPHKAKKSGKQLQKLGHLLGKKRDLDIFYDFVLHTVGAKSLSLQKLTQLIEQAQKQIISALKSKSYRHLINSLERLNTINSKQNLLQIVKKQVHKVLKTVLKIAPMIEAEANDKVLHKLRISIKGLRYVCEFFEPILSKQINALDVFIKDTKKIQDILGDHQDAITGIFMLTQYQNLFSPEEFLLIKKNYESKKMKTYKAFLRYWKSYLKRI